MSWLARWIRDVRSQRWRAVRSLAVGWAVLLALWLVVVRLVFLDDWLFARGIADLRPFWPDPRRPIFHFSIGGGVNALAGWIVGRLHREHRKTLVPLFLLSVLLYDLTQLLPEAMESLKPGHGRFWGIVTLDLLFMRLPILVAGVWGVRDPRQT